MKSPQEWNWTLWTSPPKYTPEDIKRIRNHTNMPIEVFANYLNVNPRSVYRWEAGTGKPTGSALRLLELFEIYHILEFEFEK